MCSDTLLEALTIVSLLLLVSELQLLNMQLVKLLHMLLEITFEMAQTGLFYKTLHELNFRIYITVFILN